MSSFKENIPPELNNPQFNADELQGIPLKEVDYNGISSDHKDSGNDFTQNGIKQILMDTFTIEKTIKNERKNTDEDKQIDAININVVITSVNMTPPTTTNYISAREEPLTPKVAMIENKTYAAKLYVDFEIIATAMSKGVEFKKRTDSIDNYYLGDIDIMVGSKLCNTYNKSREELLRMGEDPSDPGGYFIVKGNEWVINNIESTIYNKPKIFRNIGHRDEIARLEIISKPGDSYENSSQLYIKLLTGNQIIIIIDRAPLNTIQVPFYIMLRLLGWSSDKKMVDWIVYEYTSETSKYMLKKLELAFKAKYVNFNDSINLHNKDDILRSFVSKLDDLYSYLDLSDEKTRQFVNNKTLNSIDTYLLPHLGDSIESRDEKAIFITHLIRNLLLVEMKAIEETDRDSLKNKRAHSAGVSYAKAFKQQFNSIIVQQIKKQFTRDFKSSQFSNVDLKQSLRSSINSEDFGRALSQAITTGTKQQIVVKSGRNMINRLTSQQLHRKNHLNYVSTMRQLNSPNTNSSKQSSRANEMRRVHPSHTGYLCPIQTQDGESVGINKQLAISTSITSGSSSELLKDILLNDSRVIKLKDVSPDILSENVSIVKVNGYWIGCVRESNYFVDKYRYLRREQKIHPFTTIYWDPISNEIQFWVDTGRLKRPLLIVYNNYGDNFTGKTVKEINKINDDNGNQTDFKQWISLTKDHLLKLKEGKITINDLLKDKIIEYITPSEQENMFLAVDYDTLWEDRFNPLRKYTHCDIPTAILGFVCLNCPLGTHAPAARVILSTQQSKQACGWYSLSWPYRVDKEGFLQFHCEMPLVRTIANDYIQPNGQNCIIAIQTYSGYNQEDSIIMNKASAQRGLFDGVHFTFEQTELEKNEQFGNPDITLTANIKPYVSYEKLENGFPKKGTILNKNDVIIGKFAKMNKPEGDYIYIDRSKIYKNEEPAIVFNVILSRNQDGKPFAKIHLMVMRECSIGDKFSMRSGQKGIVGNLMEEDDMPFTSQGIIPDIIFNPHSLPSRMTINTLMEILLAKVCAIKGEVTDGTMFRKIDMQQIQQELKSLGFNHSGKEKMYNGMSGKMIDCEIFIGPVYYQRLQKFVKDTIKSISTGSTDAITRQPLEGKSSSGGIRLGEMEKDVIIGNGLSRFLSEKFYDHSDGFVVYICRGCGNYATVNNKLGIYSCKRCKDNADISTVNSSWTSKVFIQELQSMNIGFRQKINPYEYDENE